MDKKICSCGSPQSFPIPHEHDRTERENQIIKSFEEDAEDYQVCYSNWSKFLDYVTGGKMSKPNYTLKAMEDIFDERMEEDFIAKDVLIDFTERVNRLLCKKGSKNNQEQLFQEMSEITHKTGRKG